MPPLRTQAAPVAIHGALTNLLRLANVTAEQEHSVRETLALYAGALDFADAMHLSSHPHDSPFVSFDRAFIRRATRAGVTRVSTPG